MIRRPRTQGDRLAREDGRAPMSAVGSDDRLVEVQFGRKPTDQTRATAEVTSRRDDGIEHFRRLRQLADGLGCG